MLGDLRVARVADDELLLICERIALQRLFDLLRRGLIGWDAQLHKRTLELSLISVVGPEAEAVALAKPDADEHSSTPIEGGWALRTDLGLDLVVTAESVESLVAELVSRGAAVADESDLEIVRVESGRPRYGVDLDDSVIPQEAGLNERAVSFTKGCYIGQETVARLHYKGRPNRQLRGLVLAEPVRTGAVLSDGERKVGTVGSSVVSPRLGPIALALVRREEQVGEDLLAAGPDQSGEIAATIADLPFRDG
jgi:folate-binding protein YgfZ